MTGFAHAERVARLRLARTVGVGAVGFRELLARYGDTTSAIESLEKAEKRVPSIHVAEQEMAHTQHVGGRHIFVGEAGYPPLLAQLTDPPPVLLVAGDLALAARPVIGMVGARNASAAGRALAKQIAADLAQAGWVVASGLARGIDSAAHQGALAGGTIGCIASGLDIAYPPEHADLQRAIARDGLVITELPPGTEPQARHFPRRNRLIAGVAQALVVVEAAAGSGSLITARHAGDWGRDVMAVPGHPADPRSRGGNGLIREGALLVESAEDIIEALSPFVVMPKLEPAPKKRQRAVAELPLGPAVSVRTQPSDLTMFLSVHGLAIDELVRVSGLSAARVQAELTDLELDGRVQRLPGGRVALAG